MKTLFLIRALPGAGKTTLAKVICEKNVAADDYFTDQQGNYHFDASKIKSAHIYCQGKAESIMQTEEDIAVHNTFTMEWEMKPYYDLAEKYGYKVFSIVVENRHGGENTHGVPEEVIEKMRDRFEVKL